jgi:hypothetical protein
VRRDAYADANSQHDNDKSQLDSEGDSSLSLFRPALALKMLFG